MQEIQEMWVQSLGRKIPWSWKWQPVVVFLPGKFYGQKSLANYSPRGHKESYMTEQLSNAHTRHKYWLKLILFNESFLGLCILLFVLTCCFGCLRNSFYLYAACSLLYYVSLSFTSFFFKKGKYPNLLFWFPKFFLVSFFIYFETLPFMISQSCVLSNFIFISEMIFAFIFSSFLSSVLHFQKKFSSFDHISSMLSLYVDMLLCIFP